LDGNNFSKRTVHRHQRYLSLCQHPCPDPHHQRDIKEIKDKCTSKDNRIIAPSIFGGHSNSCDSNSPREHPKQIRTKSLN
jgi:hypothetical protein